jgi:hypothetical protein
MRRDHAKECCRCRTVRVDRVGSGVVLPPILSLWYLRFAPKSDQIKECSENLLLVSVRPTCVSATTAIFLTAPHKPRGYLIGGPQIFDGALMLFSRRPGLIVGRWRLSGLLLLTVSLLHLLRLLLVHLLHMLHLCPAGFLLR